MILIDRTFYFTFVMYRYDVRDFTKPVSSKGLSIYEIDISPVEMEMYIDLQPFVNPTPYIVPEDMSLTKVRANSARAGDRD